MNGKLRHSNKIKGLTQICTQFNIQQNPQLNLQTLAKENPSYFNAYVRGLFDADGSIYVKNARHARFFESLNASEYWLNRHITAKSLRIELSITGEHCLINEISKSFKVSLIKSTNKPKSDGTPSISYKLMANQSNPNINSYFTIIYSTITSNTHFVPLTVKSSKLG